VLGDIEIVHRDADQVITLEVIARSLVVRVAEDVCCALRVLKILQLLDKHLWLGSDRNVAALVVNDVRLVQADHWDAWRDDRLVRCRDYL
jgi:hypothetical protein